MPTGGTIKDKYNSIIGLPALYQVFAVYYIHQLRNLRTDFPCYKIKRGPQYTNMKNIRIYCNDLEKTIDKDGCYDAKGSPVCKACLEKPAPKKLIKLINI